jgi:hypothetical protein
VRRFCVNSSDLERERERERARERAREKEREKCLVMFGWLWFGF